MLFAAKSMVERDSRVLEIASFFFAGKAGQEC